MDGSCAIIIDNLIKVSIHTYIYVRAVHVLKAGHPVSYSCVHTYVVCLVWFSEVGFFLLSSVMFHALYVYIVRIVR